MSNQRYFHSLFQLRIRMACRSMFQLCFPSSVSPSHSRNYKSFRQTIIQSQSFVQHVRPAQRHLHLFPQRQQYHRQTGPSHCRARSISSSSSSSSSPSSTSQSAPQSPQPVSPTASSPSPTSHKQIQAQPSKHVSPSP